MRFIVLILILLSSQGHAASQFDQSVRIFEVRKSIPLSSFEKPQRDYYLNGGLLKGIRKGYIFKVYRKTSVFDPFYNKLSQDLKVEVAELRVIHADHKVSVARMFEVQDEEETVSLDYYAPMVGDQIDIQSGHRAGKKGNGQKGDLKFLDEGYHQKIKQAKQMKEKLEEESWEQSWNPTPEKQPEQPQESQAPQASAEQPTETIASTSSPADSKSEPSKEQEQTKESQQSKESLPPQQPPQKVAENAEAKSGSSPVEPSTIPLRSGIADSAASEVAPVKASKAEDVSVQVR